MRRDEKIDALTANMAELAKNMAVMAEKVTGLSAKVDAQSQRIDNMQNTLLLGLLGIFAAVVGAGWWTTRKPSANSPAAESGVSMENSRTTHNVAIGLIREELLSQLIYGTPASWDKGNLQKQPTRIRD